MVMRLSVLDVGETERNLTMQLRIDAFARVGLGEKGDWAAVI